MNPISRLRIRARSESVSDSAGLPFSQYLPSVGESSSPSSDSRVDLPQPEGPAIDTYAPWAISRCTPERACVSTSSVKKTFVTPSSLMTGCPFELMRFPPSPKKSLQAHAVVRVPSTHVREDHAIPRFETFDNLHRVHRALAELDLDARRLVAVLVDEEETHEALLLPERGTSHEQRVLEPVELDRAVDREVRPRALRELALERDVDGDRSVLRGGVDARDLPGHDAVARVDRGGLADGDVLGLRLGDLQLRLQLLGLDDLREHRPRLRELSDLDRD